MAMSAGWVDFLAGEATVSRDAVLLDVADGDGRRLDVLAIAVESPPRPDHRLLILRTREDVARQWGRVPMEVLEYGTERQ